MYTNNGDGNMNSHQMHSIHMQGSLVTRNPSQLGDQLGGSLSSGFGGRRINFGGFSGGGMERRTSLGSNPLDAALSDILGRRSNVGYDGMDVPARRDSLDSTAAVLDACILDLTRRRRIMGMGSNQGGLQSDMGYSSSLGGTNASSYLQAQSQQPSLEVRQRQLQLQQQQAELEKRQQELELQRQQLIAGLQETSMQSMSMHQSMGNHSAMTSNFNSMMPNDEMSSHHDPNPRQQWWVCQICNSKAFASPDEAMDHEQICGMAQSLPSTRPDTQANKSYRQDSMMSIESSTATNLDHGPYTTIDEPVPLAMPTDKDWLTPLHCFVRRHCVEVSLCHER